MGHGSSSLPVRYVTVITRGYSNFRFQDLIGLRMAAKRWDFGRLEWRPRLCCQQYHSIYIWVNKGNHPQMAELFRLVKYYNLPIYIYICMYVLPSGYLTVRHGIDGP